MSSNQIEIKSLKLKLDNNGIQLRDEYYPFTSIRHVGYALTKITEYTNGIKGKTPLLAELKLVPDSGDEVEMKIDERTLVHGFTRDKKDKINQLQDIVSFILNSTKESRYQKYNSELESYGYFRYGELLIYPDDKIVHDNKSFGSKMTYYLADYELGISQDELVLKRKAKSGLISKIKNSILYPDKYFSLSMDRDIIHEIFSKYCNWG